jgi:hypothetical protein
LKGIAVRTVASYLCDQEIATLLQNWTNLNSIDVDWWQSGRIEHLIRPLHWHGFFPMQLGNPVLEFATDLNSRAEYFWSHGLISDSTYKMFTSACNYSRYVSEYYRDSVSSVCSLVMKQVSTETSRFVDKYDVTLDVCIPSVLSQSKVISPKVSLHRKINCLAFTCLHSSQVCLKVFAPNFLLTASIWEDWCLYRRWNCELSEPGRCAEGSPCPAYWSSQMGSLQQVTLLY